MVGVHICWQLYWPPLTLITVNHVVQFIGGLPSPIPLWASRHLPRSQHQPGTQQIHRLHASHAVTICAAYWFGSILILKFWKFLKLKFVSFLCRIYIEFTSYIKNYKPLCQNNNMAAIIFWGNGGSLVQILSVFVWRIKLKINVIHTLTLSFIFLYFM